ncbi:MAG: hypothetical protein LDLANPLL_02440 [Turneriella sp.]|nr:hypothetical protein [Turneriella sp.]
MRQLFLKGIYFISNTVSYGASAASSAFYAAIITFVFVIYFSYTLKLPAFTELLAVVATTATITVFTHGVWFGLLHKIGFSGVTKSMRILNRSIVRGASWFSVEVKDNLNADEYRTLYHRLCYLPRDNVLMSVAMVLIIILVMAIYLVLYQNFPVANLVQVGVIAVVAAFIHGGYTAIITEIVTGQMRRRVKEIMYAKKVEFKEISLSTVRSKVLFFISIMVATLFVANFMIYYEVSFSVLVRFSLFAVAIAAAMAFMLFSVILQALREIGETAQGIHEGKHTMLFPEALDAEFINVATGLNTAMSTIRDYQHNLEQKVEQRTVELTAANEALNEKDRLIQMELDFAAEIQKGIIPTRIEEWNGLKFSSYYLPMEKVSGDYYDVFPAQGNRLGILMADVSGHGVPAALITTMAKVAFARAAQNTHSPVQTFREVNNQLLEIVTTQDYLTAFYLTIDDTHQFLFGNASHQHAKIIRKTPEPDLNKEDVEENSPVVQIESLDTAGLFVGAMSEANESYAEKAGRLNAGDRLFLYTDGLIEIRNKEGEEFGNLRFDELLKDSSRLPAEEVISYVVGEVFKFSEGTQPNDDISLLMVEVNPEYSEFLRLVASANRLIEAGNAKEGIKILDNAIGLYGKNLSALKTAAVVHFDLGNIEAAERYLKLSLELNRQDAEIFYYLSSIAILKKSFINAEKYAREAVNLRGNYALAFNNLSIASLNVGKYASARYAMEKALSLDPENAEIQKNAAHLDSFLKSVDIGG